MWEQASGGLNFKDLKRNKRLQINIWYFKCSQDWDWQIFEVLIKNNILVETTTHHFIFMLIRSYSNLFSDSRCPTSGSKTWKIFCCWILREHFSGVMIRSHCDNYVQVNYLQKSITPTRLTWKWPAKRDEVAYPHSGLKFEIIVLNLLPGGARNIVFESPEFIYRGK